MKSLKSLDLGTIITISITIVFVFCLVAGIASGQPATKNLSNTRTEKLNKTATIVTIGQSAYSVSNK